MTVKLLALAASTRAGSLNKHLLTIAVALAEQAGAKVTVLDYAECDAPLYRDEVGAALPKGAQVLGDALRAHDGLLLASPEYNWSIPGELKNLIDWLSTSKTSPFRDRAALLMCASPSVRGGISGLQQLSVPLEHLGMWVYPQLIGIGDAKTQLSADCIARDADQNHLALNVKKFVRAVRALRGIDHA